MKQRFQGYLPLNNNEFEVGDNVSSNRIKTCSFNWGPYVMATTLPDYIINGLKEAGDKLNEEANYGEHLAGHLKHQYQYKQETKEWFYRELTPYIKAYRKGHCQFHGLPEMRIDIGPIDLWINYMKPGDYNPFHIHGGDYSFVIFIDVPKELEEERKKYPGTHAAPGSLVFSYGQVQQPAIFRMEQLITPYTGDFYMFPSLLHHSVFPFKSDVTRISVSGNMAVLNRQNLPKTYF